MFLISLDKYINQWIMEREKQKKTILRKWISFRKESFKENFKCIGRVDNNNKESS